MRLSISNGVRVHGAVKIRFGIRSTGKSVLYTVSVVKGGGPPKCC